MRKVRFVIAALSVVLCLGLLVSCSANDQDSDAPASADDTANTDDTEQRYAAYYAKCQEYATLYGSPSSRELYGPQYKVATGLALVRLVDFNGDGADELLLGYITDDMGSGTMEVWAWRDENMRCIFADRFSNHGTQGGFPYAEVLARTDQEGSVLFSEHCYGSAPEKFVFEVSGFTQDGSFEVLVRRAYEYMYGATYYLCPVEVDTYWRTEEWREVSESEYEEAFAPICGEELLHLHLYELTRNDVGLCNSDSYSHLDDTIAGTRETISLLAEYAN